MWQHVAAEVIARGGQIHHNLTVHRLCTTLASGSTSEAAAPITSSPATGGPEAGHPVTGNPATCSSAAASTATGNSESGNHQETGAASPEAASGIQDVEATLPDGTRQTFRADFVLSTMPVPALLRSLSPAVPPALRAIGDGLVFRDFLTVGVLTRRLALTEPDGSPLRDNWIYMQEPGIRMTRLQIFNNWSPGMVADPATVWLGLEYVCDRNDDLWQMPEAQLQAFAIRELQTIGLLPAAAAVHATAAAAHTANTAADPGTDATGPTVGPTVDTDAVLDSCVVRAPMAYPAYFGTYHRFSEIQHYLGRFHNLFPLGRNGQHRYNNQDHSMAHCHAGRRPDCRRHLLPGRPMGRQHRADSPRIQ